MTGKLNREGGLGVITAVDRNALPRCTVGSAVFELGSKLLDSNEILIVVLFL